MRTLPRTVTLFLKLSDGGRAKRSVTSYTKNWLLPWKMHTTVRTGWISARLTFNLTALQMNTKSGIVGLHSMEHISQRICADS